jgi:sulfatase maturation enzyme AslB (radical SAM superfamily)
MMFVALKNSKHKTMEQEKHIEKNENSDGIDRAGCNYCHAREKRSLHLDYAGDEKPEKEIARSMMRMTIDINKKYFGGEPLVMGDSVLTIFCSNCHHATAHQDKTGQNH